MASEVDICNVALSHLGDAATVASISPPEGSAQAEHCAVFYPIARDALLEMHDWGFATTRAALTQVTNTTSTWAFCYAVPADMLSPFAVLDPLALDDNSAEITQASNWLQGVSLPAGGIYTPQPYQIETAADGTSILLTNQEDAVLRYVRRVTDTTRFTPLFTKTLHRSLAALLAGPVIKGEAGIKVGAMQEMIAFGRDGKSGLFGAAAASDSNQKRTTTRERHQVSWLAGR